MNLNGTIKYIKDDVILLYEKMFPLYLITGEKNFLIDCSISPYAENIRKNLLDILNGKPLSGVLLTHSHYDHTGACPLISTEFNPYIYGSQRTVELLKRKKILNYIKNLNKNFEIILNKKTDLEFNSFKNLKEVREDDSININKSKFFRVIETPGHTKCSVSYLLEPYKILFPGDATGVLERKGKIKPLFLSSYTSYLASLRKLTEINAEILALPHNSFIKGRNKVNEFLKSSISQTERIGELIRNKLKSGKSPDIIAKILAESEFPEPTVQGPIKAFTINLKAMVNAIKNEIL